MPKAAPKLSTAVVRDDDAWTAAALVDSLEEVETLRYMIAEPLSRPKKAQKICRQEVLYL
tara:strand:+ start:377 stop:556 length:180 start_codon:yes stop_codon:yes gene_type:complete